MTPRTERGRPSFAARVSSVPSRPHLVVRRPEFFGPRHVHPARLSLAVALASQSQLLALRVHHRSVVVAHVRREHELGLVAGFESRQLDVDRDARRLVHGSLPGGEPPARASTRHVVCFASACTHHHRRAQHVCASRDDCMDTIPVGYVLYEYCNMDGGLRRSFPASLRVDTRRYDSLVYFDGSK